jgi:hypothetical protein
MTEPEETVVFEDAYTGETKYGRIERRYGSDAIVRIISEEEAGPNPRRVRLRQDARIAELTDGTGVIKP